ncbi:zinc-ribbon and DUF3426 domain-containing protein [Marinomonas pollencensis]|uniref:Putative Zn finger-like uncharacterized protein n=1 Tax=Marinomonas pollencensis TaxID=491954 RepID=A0A3E0DQ50_9GAMM|nr:zinc-ribbon and DUF3426 domain-containing protein [Marinomonas pollencensis]REG84315.1 putative Zn finger-like uncharacterized protein [Marinomonas pollencensis]
MTDSLITRCPKCSTAFRVTEDVLNMAKGKVRCGQCFHIFDAMEASNTPLSTTPTPPVSDNTPDNNTYSTAPAEPTSNEPASNEPTPQNKSMLFTSADDEPVNPEWLKTLFDENDLAPGTPDDPLFDTPAQPVSAPSHSSSNESPQPHVNSGTHKDEQVKKNPPNGVKRPTHNGDEPAPWELELAEVEAALSASPKPQPIKKETIEHFVSPPKNTDSEPESKEPEPDYMVALHSLAQNAAEVESPNRVTQQNSALNQISSQEYLAPLIGEYEKEQKNHKKPRTLLWFLAALMALFALLYQLTGHFFVQGSQSENFRVFYRTFCTYTGCTLPTFVDIHAISIQHVRIQSHPTQTNALLVNAIITNTSRYAQPMPKIALEFFDLNGAPVAARLFAPKNYLDKDFLDITYMPPNTPIHLVIPIRDPGARAVTHQLRVFPAETRSY